MDSHQKLIKLQVETERRSYTLANEMWHQQIELNKTHERTMQNSLNNVIKYNRQLQEENEILQQRNSEFALKYSNASKDKTSLLSYGEQMDFAQNTFN